MAPSIRIENVSKLYRLGEVGTGTLSHDLHRAWARLRGKRDPFAKVGQLNDRTVAAASSSPPCPTSQSSDASAPPSPSNLEPRTSFLSRLSPLAARRSAPAADYVWALKDINLEIQQGEIVGIIGRNGAGKSTLLKLLSRITEPTTGRIRTKGRIASLLEVGTGFHPELTGRENIYLNGSILGMRRHEITKHLEEIVEFSGCAKYIDTPVKRYSSGMTVRLGFAVAAHLDCDILIVDEVLAVGDSEFQRKCINKMSSIAKNDGKTILFVSHNIGSVERLCNKAVRIENGRVATVGKTPQVVADYLASINSMSTNNCLNTNSNRTGTGQARLREVRIMGTRGDIKNSFLSGDCAKISFRVENLTNESIEHASLGFSLSTIKQDVLIVNYSDYQGKKISLQPRSCEISAEIGPLNLYPGTYLLGVRLISAAGELDWPRYPVAEIKIEPANEGTCPTNPHSGQGLLAVHTEWLL